MKTSNDNMENRHPDWLLFLAIGTLTFGVLAFGYTVFCEAYINNKFGKPSRPYGQPAMLSIVVCACLGGIGAGIMIELSKESRQNLLYGYIATIAVFTAWYYLAWRQWSTPKWDNSSYIIFPSVFLALVVDGIIFFLYLIRKLVRARRAHKVEYNAVRGKG